MSNQKNESPATAKQGIIAFAILLSLIAVIVFGAYSYIESKKPETGAEAQLRIEESEALGIRVQATFEASNPRMFEYPARCEAAHEKYVVGNRSFSVLREMANTCTDNFLLLIAFDRAEEVGR